MTRIAIKSNMFDECIQVLNEQRNVWKIVEQIANMNNQEYPFYVCDIDDIIQKYRTWKRVMPRIMPHYAVKCNDHPVVLKTIAALGLGFDCASKIEIDKILSLGVDPSRIIYAHTTKPPSHIRHASKVSVDLMTFDNELELHKIKQIFPNARAVIRIRYDAKATISLGIKFGCNSHTEAPGLLEIARNLGVNVVGVSFHVGWCCQDPKAFYGAIEAARHVFDVASTLGYDFELLDIGGGYPGKTNSSIEEYAKAINLGLNTFFPDQSVRVISEPGTYFVDSAFNLACNVYSLRKIVDKDPNSGESIDHYMYYINDGVFGSLNMIMTANVIKIPKLLKQYPSSKKYPSTIWGPTCNSMDLLITNILLPELQLGDWIVFTDVGAYTLTVTSSFNSFELPKVYSIISRNNWLLLRNSLSFSEDDFVVEENKFKIKPNKQLYNKLLGNIYVKG